jgi:hypothetical protein
VLPGGAPLAARAARARAGAAGYRAVGGRRSLFGRLISDAAKARADERIAGAAPGRSARQRSASST